MNFLSCGHRAGDGNTELNPRPHRHGGAPELDFAEKKSATSGTSSEAELRPHRFVFDPEKSRSLKWR